MSEYSDRFRELAARHGIMPPPYPSASFPSHEFEPLAELALMFYNYGLEDAATTSTIESLSAADGESVMVAEPQVQECWNLFGCNPQAGTHADACPAGEVGWFE